MIATQAGTSIEVVCEANDTVGECPVWDDIQRVLWWTDIEGSRLHRCWPESGRRISVATPGRVGSFALAQQGGLVLAIEHAFAWLDTATGRIIPIAEPESHMTDNRFNDGGCDPAGRFLAGSMNLPRTDASGALWRLDRDFSVAKVGSGVTVANGLAFSPDGTRMWWADSPTGRVFAFDYDAERGVATNQRLWLERGHAPGNPDGATVDADGCYWSARWRGGAVARFTPDGRLDRLIELPVQQVTMCTFGGEGFDTLYVTTARNRLSRRELDDQPLAGAVFAIRSGTRGLPARRFAGQFAAGAATAAALAKEKLQ